ncbi:uncharacterized protein [Arachis hypogaea]|uniref:uncharacterized protein isoform X3 n=1 Tax=Arachis hypogaea TaxID=3818 RepID=UPI003B2182C0
MAWCFFLAGKAFCESHSRAMAVVVAVIVRGGGYRGGGGGGGGSCNNCGYSGLLQGTAQQALAEKYLHSMLILMLQKLEFLSDLVVQPDVIVIFFWTLVILHYTLRKASLMSRGIIFILDFTYQDVILLPFLRNVALILGVAVWLNQLMIVK